jgi:hypothetical protein
MSPLVVVGCRTRKSEIGVSHCATNRIQANSIIGWQEKYFRRGSRIGKTLCFALITSAGKAVEKSFESGQAVRDRKHHPVNLDNAALGRYTGFIRIPLNKHV